MCDPDEHWLLTGIAVRLGQRLGLHNEDGTSKFSVFETQIRRRVWWQILLVDGRSGQLTGNQAPMYTDPSKFPLPANLNDAELSIEMSELPMGHKGATEMIFCLMRYGFGMFLARDGGRLHNPLTPIEEKDKILDQFESELQSNHLQYLDPAIPLHMLASGGLRSAICKMRLLVHHPGQYPDKGLTLPQSERDLLFTTSLQMVELDAVGQSIKAVENYSWHTRVYFQIDAFVFMLIESRNQDPGPLVEKAWGLVSDIYRYWPALAEPIPSNELHAAVQALTLRAWEALKANYTRRNLKPPDSPPFILEFGSRHGRHPSAATGSRAAKDVTVHNAHDQTGELRSSPTGFTSIGQEDHGLVDGFETRNQDLDEMDLGWETMNWDYWTDLLQREELQLESSQPL